jgi:3-methyladenine DNA glycosylase AlkD
MIKVEDKQVLKKQKTRDDTPPIMRRHLMELERRLMAVSNPEKAVVMKSYLKNKFDLMGIQKPERDATLKLFRKEVFSPSTEGELIDWIHLLWKQPLRDYHYVAMHECEKSRKLLTSPAGVAELENCLLHHQWWDTVDLLAANYIGGYYAKQPFEVLERRAREWIVSPDMWLNRTAILVQLKYKKQTDTGLLREAILPHATSTEFFHQKAIGWALREYAKTDKEWVQRFVEDTPLKPLSKREALKHFK